MPSNRVSGRWFHATLVVAAALTSPIAAHADRPLHGSVGAGGTLVATGARGDHLRLELTAALKPWSRFGVVAGWRAFDDHHRGLITAGVVYEGAAARPRLVLDLHGSIGADLDVRAPLAGGGVRATLTIRGPLGLVFDTGGYVIVAGVDDTRLQLQASTLLVARW